VTQPHPNQPGSFPHGVRFTAEAFQALRDVHDHISRNRPETAQRTIESILNKVDSIANQPLIYQTYQDPPPTRELTYGHFRIAYRVEEDGIIVLAVFHGLFFLPLK
jgi:plasmid stabilization system protein ParE